MFNVYGDERRALLWWYWVVTIWQIVMVTSPQYWEPVGRELKYQITKCRNIRLPTLHCTHMPLTSPRCETFSSLYNPGLYLSFDGHWSEVLRFPSFRKCFYFSPGRRISGRRGSVLQCCTYCSECCSAPGEEERFEVSLHPGQDFQASLSSHSSLQLILII